MKISEFLFDFDGTLFDSYPVMSISYQQTLQSYGIDEDLSLINSLLRISSIHNREYFKQKYPKLDDQLEIVYYQRLLANESQNKPFLEIEGLLKRIVKQGGRCYVVTHRDESTLRLLKQFNLDQYFTDIVDSTLHLARKPHPDMINYLIDKHNLQAAQCLMIGDRELDILAGINAKVKTAYFNENKVPLVECQATFEFDDYNQFFEYLENKI